MSEMTWWRGWWGEASPLWLFRAKPTEYEDHGSICPGLLFLPGLLALLLFHIAFLGFPIAILIRVGWYTGALWLTVPVLLLWCVLVSADIKFRRQGATWEQRWLFDEHLVNWFGYVFWSIMLPVGVILAVIRLVWWVVTLFV